MFKINYFFIVRLTLVFLLFLMSCNSDNESIIEQNLVGALSGHKEGSKAFARYRTIDDDMKKELIGMLE